LKIRPTDLVEIKKWQPQQRKWHKTRRGAATNAVENIDLAAGGGAKRARQVGSERRVEGAFGARR